MGAAVGADTGAAIGAEPPHAARAPSTQIGVISLPSLLM